MNAKLGAYTTQDIIEELLYRINNGEDIGYVLQQVGPEFRYANKFDISCRMTKQHWLNNVEYGFYTEQDGQGYWGTEDKISGIDAFDDAPDGMEYVYWYNK